MKNEKKPRLGLLRPEAAAVLIELEQALRRLGDDPPYYECNEGTELCQLNRALPAAINAWTASMVKRAK